jgi:hypothetical protein
VSCHVDWFRRINPSFRTATKKRKAAAVLTEIVAGGQRQKIFPSTKAKAAAGDSEPDNKLKHKAKSTSANAPKQQQPPPRKKARKTRVIDSDDESEGEDASDEEGDQADSYEQLRAWAHSLKYTDLVHENEVDNTPM